MSDKTPERLQTFREEHAPKNSGAKVATLSLAIGVMLGIAGVIATSYFLGSTSAVSRSGLSADRMRELALLYERKDMPHAAIESHTAYLEQANLSDVERGTVAYSIAKLAIDSGDYEQALKYLYRAELLAPDSEARDERSGQIVHCLEHLGRASELRRELKHRTNPSAEKPAEPGAIVLAEFGNETITDRDLERKLAAMPQSVRETFATPEKKTELLKNLVAERLLLDKAFRLNLDEDEDIQSQMNAMRDSLLVRKLMEDEVRESIVISPQDIERYYKAELERFTEPASAAVLIASADSESEAAANVEFSGKPISVRRGERLGGLPNSPAVVAMIFAAEIGAITSPVEINGRHFVFKVVSKSPERVVPFEEVKGRVEQSLRAEKEREQLQLLIEETIRARDVRIYSDRLEAKPST